jgi:glutamate dehydrogenase (NADP+)
MMQDMLRHHGEDIKGKTAAISGSGNVAQFTAEQINELGGKVLTLSDSSGFIYDPDGIDADKLEFVKDLKNNRRGRIGEYAKEYGVEFYEAQRPWGTVCDMAFPCATQNELDVDDARTLVRNGCIAVAEGANMPTYQQGVDVFREAKVLFAPSKAANAGGVAVSGLEMTQNIMRLQWSRAELCGRLRVIMSDIHERCVKYGQENGYMNYAKGANIAGFVKVADAMLAYGVM